LLAVLAMMGKGSLPPDRIMLTGSAEEKKAYLKKAYGKLAVKYMFMAFVLLVLIGVILKAQPTMIFAACGIICLALLIINKVK